MMYEIKRLNRLMKKAKSEESRHRVFMAWCRRHVDIAFPVAASTVTWIPDMVQDEGVVSQVMMFVLAWFSVAFIWFMVKWGWEPNYDGWY